MFTQLSSRKIGSIIFDAVTSENHQSELNITENPVESGALIADHACVKPKEVTITGVMVEHDHTSTPLESFGVPHIRGATDFLNAIPIPFKAATYTAQTIAKANRVISQFNTVKAQINDALNKARPIAPWLPDFGSSLMGNTGSNRVQQCYADLVAIQKSGEPIEIQTGIQLYQNMLISSISVTQTQDGNALFDITAREIFIVETATVATTGENKGGGSSISNNGGRGKNSSTSKGSKSNKSTSAVSDKRKGSAKGKEKSGRAKRQSAGKTQKGKVNISPRTPPSLDFGNTSIGGGSGKRTSVLAKILG